MEGKDGRTERATGKKREDERGKGNVCVSNEVLHFAGLLMGLIGVWVAASGFMEGSIGMMKSIFRFDALHWAWNAKMATAAFNQGAMLVGAITAPVLLAVMGGAVVASMVQTGPYYSTRAFHFNLGALNPVKGIRQLFNLQALVTLGQGLAKVALIAVTVWYVLRKDTLTILSLSHCSVSDSMAWILKTVFRLSMTVALVFLVIAVLDWCWRKYRYEQGIMMTKEEVKDELKQQDVNPVVKRMQGRKMRELSLLRMMAAVPHANVVITNPTHVAVALEYDPEKMAAPRVVAKGLRLVAARIKGIAAENHVPILERPELARSLYKHVKVGHEIPAKFYEAVANVLAFLHRIGKGIKMAM